MNKDSFLHKAFDLYYDGFRLAATANMHLAHNLHVGMKLGTTHYFNKSTIGIGAQKINSSWCTDLSIQLRWTFGVRKRRANILI